MRPEKYPHVNSHTSAKVFFDLSGQTAWRTLRRILPFIKIRHHDEHLPSKLWEIIFPLVVNMKTHAHCFVRRHICSFSVCFHRARIFFFKNECVANLHPFNIFPLQAILKDKAFFFCEIKRPNACGGKRGYGFRPSVWADL